MTLPEVLKELSYYADEQTKKTFMRHGAKEPLYGVKVGDLKKILKKTKKNHELSLQLYDTGNSDAMYLAGLMADEKKISASQLDAWVDKAYWSYLSEFAVPWVAGESAHGFKLGQKWIKSKKETTAAAGWAALSSYASVHDDSEIDVDAYSALLDEVAAKIHLAQNREKYAMNSFVISIGSYIQSLNAKAMKIAKSIGEVSVDVHGTACKVPLATEYLDKVKSKGNIGKKRSSARC